MGLGGLGRWAALMYAAFFVTGCGAAGSAGVPQGAAMQARAHSGSGSSGDLLYITTSKKIEIVSYPHWSMVAKIPGRWYSLCSDANNGNVFAVGPNYQVTEFAHGGTTPIATLTAPPGYAGLGACSVDPTSGKVAVPASQGPNNHGAILIFAPGQQNATTYSDSKLLTFNAAAYDDNGNLYTSAQNKEKGPRIAALLVGQKQLKIIKYGEVHLPLKMQWDGRYLVYQVALGPPGTWVYQMQIDGQKGTIVNTVEVSNSNTDSFWLDKGSLFSFYYPPKAGNNYAVAVWPYPAGGDPTSKFFGLTKGKRDYPFDLTVSVAPSR